MYIEHQPGQSRFVFGPPHNQSVLQYHVSSGIVDFCRTFVPVEQRRQGLGEQLVHEGLNWARHQNLEIRASCSFVQKFLL